MAHIFISYAHADKAHLNRLVDWLHNNEFSSDELWYDHHIEGGNNWRDEITTALDSAFVVLVIVTPTSTKSLYCTYEWAYALGQGIPILPLVFDTINIVDVPTPLTTKQFINCTNDIPLDLERQIADLRSTSPEVDVINKLVYDAIYDVHRQFFILGWVGGGLRAIDSETVKTVLDDFVIKASESRQALQSLMVDKSFAFSGRQYRFCWNLIDLLKVISRLSYRLDIDEFSDPIFLRFENEWLPAFEYFEGKKYWSKWIKSYFDRDLEDKRTQMNVFTEMVRAFPLLDSSDIDILIQNKIIDQKRRSSSS